MSEGMQNKPVQDMTEKELRSLPHRGWNEAVAFTGLIILPAKYDLWGSVRFALKRLAARLFRLQPPGIWEIGHLHDSGYRCLDFVAVDGSKPLCRLAGCSDVIHIDGIGGYGMNWLEKYSTVPVLIPPSGWSIDCLPKSGLLRMWASSGRMVCGPSLSSFEIYALEAEEAAWLHDLERSQERELDTAESAGERRFVKRDLGLTRAAVESVERNEIEQEEVKNGRQN